MENIIIDSREKIINKWISDYVDNCDKHDINTKQLEIAHFLDVVVLNLFNSKFNNDVDCPFESQEEADNFYINYVKEKYHYIIDIFPLEVLYFYGYTYANKGLFLTEYILGKKPGYNFQENILEERYNGKFTDKMESILINKLGVKKLIK